MKIHNVRRGFHRGVLGGRLVQGLEDATQSLKTARGCQELLSAADRVLLQQAIDTCIGLQQRAWEAIDKESKGCMKR
jgi:hypothetical protein